MIKASLILLVAYCVSRLLRHRSAAERHMLWVAAISSAALLPLFSLLVPEWRLEMANKLATVLSVLPPAGQIPSTPENAGVTIHANGIEARSEIGFVLLVVWATGSLVTLLLLFAGSVALRRIAARSQSLSEPVWVRLTAELGRALGFKRTIYLLQSSYSSMPLTWGICRPRVLIPASSSEWSDDRRFVVLAHELAHVRRFDWLFQILAELACAIYWFHPLFWIARNQLHLESERACDDAVLGLGIEGQDYATHLLDIARALKKRSPTWSLAMARRFNLEKRLVAILNSTANRRALTWKAAFTIVFAVICLALPLAAIRAAAPETKLDLHATIESAETLPHVVEYTTPPLYSDEARARKVEGTVTVEVRIDVDGRAKNLRVVSGLGFGLDENALLAVRDWRFVAGKRNGPSAGAVMHVDVEFNLRNAELNELIANDMATRVGPGVVPPRIIHRVEPHYPEEAFTEGHFGSVMLDAVIQEDGIPKVVRVVRSLAWELDEAAITALEQWRFSPALKNDIPVKVRMNVEMNFDLPKK